MPNTTGHPSQMPSGLPEDNAQIPKAPRVPNVVVPYEEIDSRRRAIRESAEQVIAGRGSEAPALKPNVIPYRPRPVAKTKLRGPRQPVKARERGDRGRTYGRSDDLAPFPLKKDPPVTSIARGYVTQEDPAVLNDNKVMAKSRGQERVYVLFMKHDSSQENFQKIGLDEAARRLINVKKQFPYMNESDADDIALFNRVAEIMLSCLDFRRNQINDACVDSVVKLVKDDRPARTIMGTLYGYTKSVPKKRSQGNRRAKRETK